MAVVSLPGKHHQLLVKEEEEANGRVFSLDCGPSQSLKEGKSVYTETRCFCFAHFSRYFFFCFFFVHGRNLLAFFSRNVVVTAKSTDDGRLFSSQASRSARQIEKSRSPATWSNSFNFLETMTNRGTKESCCCCICVAESLCSVVGCCTRIFFRIAITKLQPLAAWETSVEICFSYPKRKTPLCVLLSECFPFYQFQLNNKGEASQVTGRS